MRENVLIRGVKRGLLVLFAVSATAAILLSGGEGKTVSAATVPKADNIEQTAQTVTYTASPYLYTYSAGSNPDNIDSSGTSLPLSSFTSAGQMTGNNWSSGSTEDKYFKAAVLYFVFPTVTVPAHTAVTYQVSCTAKGKKTATGWSVGNLANFTQYFSETGIEEMPESVVVANGANGVDNAITASSGNAVQYSRTFLSEGNYAFVNRSDDAKTFAPKNNLLYCAKVNYYKAVFVYNSKLSVSSIACTVTVSFETMTEDTRVSLTLDGSIGLNFYLDVDYYTDDKTSSYVEMTYNRNKTSYDTTRTSERRTLGEMTAEADGCYKFTAYLTAGQLCDPVDLVLYDAAGNRLFAIEGYTAKTYLEKVASDVSDEKLSALCRALLRYGGAAQRYFGYAANTPADADLAPSDDLSGVTAEQIPAFSALTGAAEGFSVRAVSFLALDSSSIRIYYRLSEGTIGDYAVAVSDGFSVRLGGEGTDAPYIEVYGISSVRLGEAFTLTVTKNGAAEGLSLTYSATDFAKKVVSKNADAAQVEMFKALYLYHRAAAEYFGR